MNGIRQCHQLPFGHRPRSSEGVVNLHQPPSKLKQADAGVEVPVKKMLYHHRQFAKAQASSQVIVRASKIQRRRSSGLLGLNRSRSKSVSRLKSRARKSSWTYKLSSPSGRVTVRASLTNPDSPDVPRKTNSISWQEDRGVA